MSKWMKAARIFEHGGPEVLRYGEYSQPGLGPFDVKVRVLASSISRFDIKYRNGEFARASLPGRKPFPMPMQLGRDAAGIVEEVGEQVQTSKPGDRVVGLVHPANPLSMLAIKGLGNLSTDIEYPGHTMFGGNAQFVSRPQSYWLPLPDGVEMIDAAAALWSYATSHRILKDRLNAGAGDTLLVIGASGGMGTATVDLARAMGIRVIATTRSEAKAGFLRERGAAHVVVLTDPGEALREIRSVAGGMGVDGAVEYSADPAMLRLCVDALRPGGSLVPMAGEGSRDPMPVTVADCVRLELNIRAARGSNVSDQHAVLALLAQRKIRPAIDDVMPLAEIAQAHARLEAGGVLGRIVLTPWN